MRILLTGHKGFIGTHLEKALRQRQHEVFTLDCGKDLATWRHAFLSLNLQGIDLVIHAGAISDSRATGNHLWQMNYETTKEIAEWVLYRNVRLLFLSSCTAAAPQNQYAWTKRVAEDIVAMTIPPRNLSIFRLFNVWAFNEPQTKANRSIISKLITGDLEHVYKHCSRYFIHVTDVVNAIVRQTEGFTSGVHEIRTPKNTLIERLVDAVYAKLTGPIPKPTLVNCPIAKQVVTAGPILPDWEAEIDLSEKTDEIADALEHSYCLKRQGLEREGP